MNVNKPKQYIDKEFTFLGKKFYIDQGAHIPRHSTEFITVHYINSINNLSKSDLVVADVGTGTGVLSVSIASQCPNVKKVYAIDLFENALQVASINRSNFNLEDKIELLQGDLFEPLLDKQVDVIIANLPFADDNKMKALRSEVIKYEPMTGIYGGRTGFELYERLFKQLEKYSYFRYLKGLWIYCNLEHKPRIEYFHRSLFNNFNLNIVEDKYKPYYLHAYFHRR